MNKSKIIYTVFFILCLLRLHSQESFGGTPMFFEASQRNDVWSFDSQTIKINKKIFDFINNDKEQNKADSIAKQYSFQKKQFYGLGLPLNIDFKKTATVINISDSGKLYLLELESLLMPYRYILIGLRYPTGHECSFMTKIGQCF